MRSEIIARRTYARPKENGTFETWPEIIERVTQHMRWLWERARQRRLGSTHIEELDELKDLMLKRKVLPAGRTLWLGGTDVAKRREASQFNCSYLKVETVHDIVDFFWLLLQGCGVGAKPIPGVINGFTQPIFNVEYVRSQSDSTGGNPKNVETFDRETGTWTIVVGDSAEAWSKAIGKLFAGKHRAQKLVIDMSHIRAAGSRLKGYGWISQGDEALYRALKAIVTLLNHRAGTLLSAHDIHDLLNWLGTVLSSRRSAEIMLYDYGSPGWREFASFKKDWWKHDRAHRQQSNNSLLFWSKPSPKALREIFDLMMDAGGSEPGFINADAAMRRAPWFSGVNPCAEILLANKAFCNLVEVNVAAFHRDPAGLRRAVSLIARANYRQTCVDLRDGVLQTSWHENNEFLRLCGVGLTGIVACPDLTAYDLKMLRNCAITGAYSMAEELKTPLPKLVTTVKPSGTLSKIMNTTEGAHRPLGRYIFNQVKFGEHDPLLPSLERAGYRIVQSDEPGSVLVTLPVDYPTVEFTTVNGADVNLEPAVAQLQRYKMLMDNYVDHNASLTVYYDPAEVDDMVRWMDANWDSYVGVSFLYRTDPTKTAKDLGYSYLPQEVVTEDVYKAYVESLQPLSLEYDEGEALVDEACVGAVCPVR